MLHKLRPDMIVDSYRQIDLQVLKQKGIKGIITDLDNTLVPWNESSVEERLHNWLQQVRDQGFYLCIVSNNSLRRGGDFARELGVPAVWRAAKPRRKAFRQALDTLGLAPEQVAVLGDQLFTDIFGGNRLSLYTILVQPISKREFIGTRLMRILERAVLKYWVNIGDGSHDSQAGNHNEVKK